MNTLQNHPFYNLYNSTNPVNNVFIVIYPEVPSLEAATERIVKLSIALEGETGKVIFETIHAYLNYSNLRPSDSIDEESVVEFFSDGEMTRSEAKRFLERFAEAYGLTSGEKQDSIEDENQRSLYNGGQL